jgi:hypothetical protein
MATLESDDPQYRRKKTVWLMAGGAASLLIPLAGAMYLHWSQNAGASGPSGRSDVFERREGEDRKIVPTQTAVVLSPPGLMAPSSAAGTTDKTAASSLDFIKSNADLQARIADPKAAAAAPAVSTAPAAPAAAAVAAAKKGDKKGKKAFAMPKLQPSRGFTNFGSTGSKGAASTGAQPGTAGGQSAQDMMKNLPPGAVNDPRVQAYLKSQQGQ